MKEGMTITDASQIIDLLATYYSKKKENDATTPPTDNTRNAEITIKSIERLKLTDEAYTTIMKNSDLNNESKINMIKTTMNKTLTKNDSQPNMTMDVYRGIVKTLDDASLKEQPELQVNEIKKTVYENSKDTRFSYIFDGTAVYADDAARVTELRTAAYNTVNSV
jgi:hypothetical protein